MNVGWGLAGKGVRESGRREREGRGWVWQECVTYVYATVDYRKVNYKNKFKKLCKQHPQDTVFMAIASLHLDWASWAWPNQVPMIQLRKWFGMGNNSESSGFCQDSFSCACRERLSACSMISAPYHPVRWSSQETEQQRREENWDAEQSKSLALVPQCSYAWANRGFR